MNANAWLKKLTLDEKIALLTGKDFWHTKPIERLNIPSILMTDGPHGLRKQRDSKELGISESVPAVSYPTAVNLASSWDIELIEELGKRIGTHAVHEGISIVLGPGTNIKRSPLCGRNFEYFSEDPHLSGRLAAAWIKGIQSTGVGASLKHFALNNQETRRMTLDVYADERAMHEIYLEPFRYAVKYGKPKTVMASYNKVNGSYATENSLLLHEILRTKWNYQGCTISDWGATNDRVNSLNAGLDLEMPSSHQMRNKTILKAIKTKQLSIKTLDERVLTILKLVASSPTFTSHSEAYDFTRDERFAKKVAEESIVLLKNHKQKLPLKPNTSVALIGALAKSMRYQGAGSSRIQPTKIVSLNDEFNHSKHTFTFSEGYNINGETNEEAIQDALDTAKKHDVIVTCIGLTEKDESEGFDRTHLAIPNNQIKLIETLSSISKPLIVVLFGGSPVEMPWAKHADAIINAYLPGQMGGSAILDILYGDVNPSGKLAETYPMSLNDVPFTQPFDKKDIALYKESIFVGYRYYDTAHKDVLFPFGHGLSYTNFHYQNLTQSHQKATNSDRITVTFDITNTGQTFGKEVVQVYLKMEDSKIFREEKALKAFKKIALKPRETQTISIVLKPHDFMYYNTLANTHTLENGTYTILIGSSSRDIRLKTSLKLRNTEKSVTVPKEYKSLQSYHQLRDHNHTFTKEAFQKLYQKSLPQEATSKKVTLNTPIGDLSDYRLGRKIIRMVEKNIHEQGITDETMIRMMEHVLKEMPLRALAMMSEGKLTLTTTQGFVDVMNKKRLKGTIKILKGTLTKR